MKKSSSILINKKTISSIAIGGFDGMHKAHQQLFNELGNNGGIVSIESGFANLTPKTYRQEHSIYPIYYYDLAKIKHLEGIEFINLLKKEFPNLSKIVVGFDFCFGKDRKNDISSLKKLFDGEVVVIEEYKVCNKAVHSRHIREYIQSGNIKKANEFLGRAYKVFGKQEKGQGLGSKSFVPTINLKVKNFLLPNEGVYATKTILNEKKYDSVTFLGHRATTDNEYAIETHLLDTKLSNSYEVVQVKFIDKIRNNQKFDSFEDLKEQIFIDINKAKEILKK